MIKTNSLIHIIDNSGIKLIKCIGIKNNIKTAKIFNYIKGSVKKIIISSKRNKSDL